MPYDDPLKEAREATAELVKNFVGSGGSAKQSFSRADLVEMGKEFWKNSYAYTSDDCRAFEVLAQSARTSATAEGATLKDLVGASSILYLPVNQITFFASARWADQAFPTIQMGHKYASALMSTSVSAEDVAELQAPFKAFMIDVPDKLLPVEDPKTGKLFDIHFILAQQLVDHRGSLVWNYVAMAEHVSLWRHGLTNEMLAENRDLPEGAIDWGTYSFGLPTDDRDERLSFLIGRLIVNTCLAMATEDNVRATGKTHLVGHRHLRECPEPLVRTYVIGKPLTLDCREGIHRYLNGQTRVGSSPTVQVLVTGHWKGQPYGPRNTLRKRIWRQPFWRGPEDAPILVRPRVTHPDDPEEKVPDDPASV
jgi:hypothetical protein